MQRGELIINSKEAILIVDDEVTYCAVIEEILRSYGFNTYVANNASEALLLLEDSLPDLILLDIMMPEIDGITFVRRIRSNPLWDNIPIIIASARPMAEGQDSVVDVGANAFLSKPFSAKELRTVLREFLAVPESGILGT
jgi:CheY-like chemotaxis protein